MQLLLKPPPQCRLLHLLIFLVLSFFFHTTTTSNKRKAAATVAATSRKAGGILTSERGEVMPRVLPFVTILVLLFLLLSSAATDGHPATVPASPEWSSAACPLDIPDDLLHDIATACSPVDSGSDTHSHSQSATLSRCCPSLAASLHAAHAAAALAVLSPASNNGSAVPDPPDDSEGCASAAEVALRARGVLLPRPNETCDLTYCYCGVRLRRLHCPGPFVASAAGGRWVPANEDTATLIQTECRLPELDGCTRCLHSLYQLRSEEAEGVTSDVTAMDRQRECQLMGLTWLLDENRAHYLHVAALVLRAFMASPTGVDPTSCSVPGGTADDIPLLVDSGWVGAGSSSTFRSFFLCALSLFLLTINH